MAASASDLLLEVGTPGTATTLSANYTIGGTSITVASTANWPTTTGVVFAMDEAETVNGQEVQVAGTYREFIGTVATATSVTNVDCVYGTDRDFDAGATTRVYVPVSAERENRIVEWGLLHADQDGTLKAGAVDNTAVLADDVVTRAKINDADQIGIAGSYVPQGHMINGKIETSVATNDLTVSIKTLAGTNPSATDPVHVRIGNTVRSITSALSVTKTDGTNWFNSGSSELATQEVDYFVYLGYNSTDGVTIGFARIPYARVYFDFSATSTNDKYCAISTITNATATDEYENVGRFNAILSATATFLWSLPGTSIIINRPISETRWLTFAPVWTGITPGNGVNTEAKYMRQGRVVFTRGLFTCGTTSSGTTSVSPIATLPVTAQAYSGNVTPVGWWRYGSSGAYTADVRLSSTTAFTLVSFAVSGSTVVDSNLPVAIANGYILSYQFLYETA